MNMKRICNFRGRKGENEPSEPKNGIWGSKSVWSCDISIDRKFYMQHATRKNIPLGVKKVKISLQSPKTKFGAQIQYDHVTYPSIENFICSKKKIL
jgi:hypothetical protein